MVALTSRRTFHYISVNSALVPAFQILHWSREITTNIRGKTPSIFHTRFITMILRKSHSSFQKLPQAVDYGWENSSETIL